MTLPNPPEGSKVYDYYTYHYEPNGDCYHWDPDFQCWHQVLSQEQYDKLTHWQKYNWLYWSLACVVAFIYFVL